MINVLLLVVFGVLCSGTPETKIVTVMRNGRNPIFKAGFTEKEFHVAVEGKDGMKRIILTLDCKTSAETLLLETEEKLQELWTKGGIAIRDPIDTKEKSIRKWKFLPEDGTTVTVDQKIVKISYPENSPLNEVSFPEIRHRVKVVEQNQDLSKENPYTCSSFLEFDGTRSGNKLIVDMQSVDKEELEGTAKNIKENLRPGSPYHVYLKVTPKNVLPLEERTPLWMKLLEPTFSLGSDDSFEISFVGEEPVNRENLKMKYRMKVMGKGKNPFKEASLLEFNCTGTYEFINKNWFTVDTMTERNVLDDPKIKLKSTSDKEIDNQILKLLAEGAFLVVTQKSESIAKGTHLNLPNYQILETNSEFLTNIATCGIGLLRIYFKTKKPFITLMQKYDIRIGSSSTSYLDNKSESTDFVAYEASQYTTFQMTVADGFDAEQLAYKLQGWIDGEFYVAARPWLGVEKNDKKGEWQILLPPLDTIWKLGNGVRSIGIINTDNGIFHFGRKYDWKQKANLPKLHFDSSMMHYVDGVPSTCSNAVNTQLCLRLFDCIKMKNDNPAPAKTDGYHLVGPKYAGPINANTIVLRWLHTEETITIGGVQRTAPVIPRLLQKLTTELLVLGEEAGTSNSRNAAAGLCVIEDGTLRAKRRVENDKGLATLYFDMNNTLVFIKSKKEDLLKVDRKISVDKILYLDDRMPGLYFTQFVSRRPELKDTLKKLCQPYGPFQCVIFSSSGGVYVNTAAKAIQENGHFFLDVMTEYDTFLIPFLKTPKGCGESPAPSNNKDGSPATPWTDKDFMNKKDVAGRAKNKTSIVLDNTPGRVQFGNKIDPNARGNHGDWDQDVLGMPAYGQNVQADQFTGKYDTMEEIAIKILQVPANGFKQWIIQNHKLVKPSTLKN